VAWGGRVEKGRGSVTSKARADGAIFLMIFNYILNAEC
jgi:hypothetical protein